MNIKRILTAVIGFPIVACVLIFGNNPVISVLMGLATIRCLYEFKNCAKGKYNVISWVGYLLIAYLFATSYIPIGISEVINIILIPLIMIVLFLHSIISDMKINFSDIAITMFGICYFGIFTSFLPKIYMLENGKILIWYVLMVSWGSDTLAYIIGKHFGKHKFSKVSPNKTIEGCIAGVAGAMILSLVYTFFMNQNFSLGFNYITIAWVSAFLCIIGQIGDFAASVIKRFLEVKDYSNLFPGHGGMVDRMDSVIAIAPFAYLLFSLMS